MRYRDHRGGLTESLKTTIEVNSIDELKAHLNEIWKMYGLSVEEIKFEYSGMDSRIGWDTYYVLQRLSNEKEFSVAGMSDGKL